MSEKTEEEPKKTTKDPTAPFQMRVPKGLLDFFKEEAKKMDVSLNNYMLYMMIDHRANTEK